MKNHNFINLKVEEVKEKITGALIEAKLPVCVVDYILTEILNDVRLQRIEAVKLEKDELKRIENEEETDDFTPHLVDSEKIG